MFRINYLALALAGTALAAIPVSAGGPRGRTAGNCLCQTVSGLTGGKSLAGGRTLGRGPAGHSGLIRSGQIGNRMIRGNVTGSVSKALGVTASRSANRHGKSASLGMAGTVTGAANAAGSISGVGRGIGLAGTSLTKGSTGTAISQSVGGLGTGHGRPPLHMTGNGKPIPGKALGHGNNHVLAGQVTGIANVSVANKTGARGRHLANVAVLNGSGGTAGKVANVSALNRTGTTGRSQANVAVLNGSGGTSGKVANVSALNKSGTSGPSLVNVAALNGTNGGSGWVANVAIANGRGGKGVVGLPNGIRIINGVPCGPDGTPLKGQALAQALVMLGNGGGGSGGPAAPRSGGGKGGATATDGRVGSGGTSTVPGHATAVPKQRPKGANIPHHNIDRAEGWWMVSH